MTRWLPTALAVLVTLLILGLTYRSPADRAPAVLDGMHRSPAREAGEATSAGLPAPVPPPGTVTRAGAPPGYPPTRAGRKRAGEELSLPDAADPARGGELFARHCVTCHGRAGAGDGPTAQRSRFFAQPLDTSRARLAADGELYHLLTYGRGSMPPQAERLTPGERWAVIAWLRGQWADPAVSSSGEEGS